MARIIRSANVVADLQEIWLHIARDNLSAADATIQRFQHRFELLAANPLMGRSLALFARDLRFAPVGEYNIFYRPFPDGILLVRVLSGSRNPVPQFFD